MKLLFFALISFFITPMAFAFDAQIKVMTFNIHDLPWPEKKKDHGEVLRIGELLGEMRTAGVQPQVVFLQEAFSNKIKKFVASSGYKYVAKGPGRGTHVFPSGNYILSDYKILHVAKVAYGFACAGLDCGANKGATVAEIEIPGLPETVFVAVTHLNSGKASWASEAHYVAARTKQIGKLGNLLHHVGYEGRAVIVGGDFNTAVLKPTWDVLRSTLSMNLAQEECFHSPDTCQRLSDDDENQFFMKRPDHIFYQSSEAVELVPVSIAKTFKGQYNGVPLSDHTALEVVFRVQAK